jgi:hypothetical protein
MKREVIIINKVLKFWVPSLYCEVAGIVKRLKIDLGICVLCLVLVLDEPKVILE